MLKLDLSLESAAWLASAFSPRQLFSASQTGAWYDPSDLATLWKDTAGTDPVTADGDAVARIDDKSGNGNHLTQATAAARPLYKTAGGLHWLDFDGTDDRLATGAFTITQPLDRISAVHQVAWTANDIIFGDNAVNFGGLLQQSGTTPAIRIYSGLGVSNSGLALGANGVVTERHNGASSRIAVNAGAYSTGDAGTTVPAVVSIGAYSDGISSSQMRLYGMVMIGRALTDSEIADTRSFMAGKSGVTL